MDIFVAVDNECTFLSRNFSVYITISLESAKRQVAKLNMLIFFNLIDRIGDEDIRGTAQVETNL